MLFYIVNYNVIWASIISAIIGAAAVVAFFLLKNKGKKSTEDMKPSPKKDILLGLHDNAEAFSDLLEPLFLLASGKTARKDYVLDSFKERVNALEGNEAFKEAYNKKFGDIASFKGKKGKYVRCAGSLLKYVFKAGIEREDDDTVVANETTAEKYDIIGTGSIVAGETYDVFVPYWEVESEENKILSKGAIR